MNNSDESAALSNSRKLDKIVFLLEGEGDDSPGLIKVVARHSELIYGRHGRDGLVHRVDTMWRIHVWLLCSASAGIGFFIRDVVSYIIKHI